MFDSSLCTTIKLKQGEGDDASNVYLYLKEVEENLALVCLVGELEFKKHLININIDKIKIGLKQIFEAFKSE